MSTNDETIITERTESGRLDYQNPPAFDHEVGDLAIIGDTWDLWVDGAQRSIPVLYIEIESREREYVVEEGEWYCNYRVAHYDHRAEHVLTCSLDTEDLEDVEFGASRESDKNARELIEEELNE